MEEAAKALHAAAPGCRAVLIKGGHMVGPLAAGAGASAGSAGAYKKAVGLRQRKILPLWRDCGWYAHVALEIY